MPESWKTRLFRWGCNLHPAIRGTGQWVTYISSDWRVLTLKLPLSWRTRNYVGTIFGGSLYGAVDPHYMVMLIHILGPGYVVWNKASTIRFRKPGRSTLFARFEISEEEVDTIRRLTSDGSPVDRLFAVDLVDAQGETHASVEETLYIRRKDAVRPGG